MAAQFDSPYGVAVGPDGTVYVADRFNNQIRMIQKDRVTTLAGTGVAGFLDGPASEAQFDTPTNLAIDADGVIYVTDLVNARVRMIRNNQVSTLAGNGFEGMADGPAAQAQFFYPVSVGVGPNGAVYVCDTDNNRIRMVFKERVTTFAGEGRSGYADGPAADALFHHPVGIHVSVDGTIYIAESGNNRIRKILNGVVTSLAGSIPGFQDGPASTALFSDPNSIALGESDVIYVADTDNHRIRMIRNGQVSTLAGSTRGFADGPIAHATFDSPTSLAVSHDGIIYIADEGNHRVRMIRDGQVFTVAGGSAGAADGPSLVTIPYYGNQGEFELSKGIDITTDLRLKIGDAEIDLHRSFVQQRCPALLKSSLYIHAVDVVSVELFRKFLYSNDLPDVECRSSHLMGLAYLLFTVDMKPFAFSLLDRLQRYPTTEAQRDSLSMQQLIQLYSYSMDLTPFAEAQKVALYLLQKHTALLRPHMKSVPQWLGKHSDKVMELMQELLVPFDTLQPPITPQMLATKGSFASLSETLAALYQERKKTGDFEIAIRGDEKKVEKVHSYVMYAMWPYFCHMYDSGMKEKHQRRLELPGVGEDGAMPPDVLDLVIEVCYKPDSLRKNVPDRVTADVVLSILPVAQMYLGDTNPDQTNKGPVTKLMGIVQAQFVNGLTLENCVQIYQQAFHYGLNKVADSAREMIVRNAKTLAANPERKADFEALSFEAHLALFYKMAANQ